MGKLADAIEMCRAGRELPLSIFPGIVDDLYSDTVAIEEKASFLRVFSDKGETAREVQALAAALLPRAISPGFTGEWNGQPIFDCSGTGGGGLPLLNISTGIVFILAALGVPVVKHGNRGVTKKSGSADVLEALGIKIDSNPAQLRETMERVGAAFIFAPNYYPAFSKLAPARKMLADEGRRTVFNLLGPILNPAQPATQMVGVFENDLLDLYAGILRRSGRKRWLVVLGMDDEESRAVGEVSVTGENIYASGLSENEKPDDWLIEKFAGALHELLVDTAAESAERLLAVLEGDDTGSGRALILANAAAGMCVQGKIIDYSEALAACEEAVDSGAALKKLRIWQDLSKSMSA